MCPLMGIRILAALVTRKKWRIDNELKNEYAFLNSITEMRIFLYYLQLTVLADIKYFGFLLRHSMDFF